MSNNNSNVSTPWNSSDSNLTTPAKNRKNESKRFEFSDQKVYGFGLQAGFKIGL